MEDKETLIRSMTNLINHISVSRKNQEEIFDSLSVRDFQKIISNLDDPLLKLRNKTVHLIGELLYNNQILKFKFCDILGVTYANNIHSPNKVVLNKNMGALLKKNPSRIHQILTLLKNQQQNRLTAHNNHPLEVRKGLEIIKNANKTPQYSNTSVEKNYTESTQAINNPKMSSSTLLWYINLKNIQKPLQVQHVEKQNISSLFFMRPQGNIQPQSTSLQDNFIDPTNCLIGFYLGSRDCIDLQVNSGLASYKQASTIRNNDSINPSISGYRSKYKQNLNVSGPLQSPKMLIAGYGYHKPQKTCENMGNGLSQKPHNKSYEYHEDGDRSKHNKGPIQNNQHQFKQINGVRLSLANKPKISLNSSLHHRKVSRTNNSMNYSYHQDQLKSNNNSTFHYPHESQLKNNIRNMNNSDVNFKMMSPSSFKPIALGTYRGCETTREAKTATSHIYDGKVLYRKN